MRLRDKLKNVGTDVWDTVKRVVIPAFISIGGTVSAIGGSLFILPRFVKYLTDEDDHPASLYASLAVIVFTIIISLATRFPAIFRHFSPANDNHTSHDELPQSEIKEIEKKFECDPASALWFTAKCFEYVTRTNSYASAGFMLLGSYLNAITVIEFLSKQANTDPHDGIAEYITQATALTLAVCATAKYAIFSLKKANTNAKNIARNIENRTFPTDKAAMITFVVSSFSTMAVPFLGYFSTTNALGKIPLIHLPDKVKHSLAIFSSVTSTTTHLTTQVPAVYAFLSRHNNQVIFAEKSWWETPSKIIVFGFAGVGDFLAANISVFTSVNTTSHDVFGINPKQPGLIVACSITALSTATLNYFFSVYRGYEDTLLHYHIARGDDEYLVIEEKDIEAGVTEQSALTTQENKNHDPKVSFYQNNPTQLIFTKKSSIEVPEEEDDIALSLTP